MDLPQPRPLATRPTEQGKALVPATDRCRWAFAVATADLGGPRTAVYQVALYLVYRSMDGEARFSRGTVARALGVSERTVIRAFKQLKNARLLIRTKKSKGGRPNFYRMAFPPCHGSHGVQDEPCQARQGANGEPCQARQGEPCHECQPTLTAPTPNPDSPGGEPCHGSQTHSNIQSNIQRGADGPRHGSADTGPGHAPVIAPLNESAQAERIKIRQECQAEGMSKGEAMALCRHLDGAARRFYGNPNGAQMRATYEAARIAGATGLRVSEWPDPRQVPTPALEECTT